MIPKQLGSQGVEHEALSRESTKSCRIHVGDLAEFIANKSHKPVGLLGFMSVGFVTETYMCSRVVFNQNTAY